jgi:hypothetical protein
MPSDPAGTVVVLMPVFNDWNTALKLLGHLDEEFAAGNLAGEVLLIDDGSTEPAPRPEAPWRALRSVRVVELRRNLGHQRALCVGLSHLHAVATDAPVVVMDADGEDDPGDVSRLLAEYRRREGTAAIFAARAKRAEGPLFRGLYLLYRLLHRLLVGQDIRVGNFSVLPPSFLDPLAVSSDLWNHYAATVFRSGLPVGMVPVNRAQRIAGRSRMSLPGLVLHGLSAMSVFSDIIGVRMLFSSAGLFVLAVAGLAATTPLAWSHLGATSVVGPAGGLLLVLILQSLMLCLAFCFVLLRGRSGPGFLPARDCPHFIRRVRVLG